MKTKYQILSAIREIENNTDTNKADKRKLKLLYAELNELNRNHKEINRAKYEIHNGL